MENLMKTVGEVLEENKMTRNDDFYLYYEVCKKLGVTNMNNITARDFLICHKTLDLPSYETVTRCRRKIQSEGKFLAEDKIRNFRDKLEKDYREEFA